MFDKNSQLVRAWARLISEGVYTREQVPNLSNLREMVGEVLDGESKATDSLT